MSDKVYKPGDVIPVGYEGEENARAAYIDIAPLREMWPQAAVQLLIVRPKESVPYPAAIADEGDRIAWTIRAEDAAVTGHGSYQVLMRDSEGGILGKSTIGATMIKTSLPASTGETPEAAKSWVSEVLDAAKRAEDAAERAESAGGTGGGGGVDFEVDDTLTLKDGILSVNTAKAVEEDNTLPVTSAAVYTEVGNINALLATI